MNSILTIDYEIKFLKFYLERLKGRDIEVYSRIVGYYRPIKNWNAGQREAYSERKTFILTPKAL
jgi:hypothetical protein